MKKVLRIGIDKPCGENWAAFPKSRENFVLKGHCASCNKHVIDFTTWSDERLIEYFKDPNKKICGRVQLGQLKSYVINESNSNSRSTLYSLLLTALISIYSRSLTAQTIPLPEEERLYPTFPSYTSGDCIPGNVCIKGSVLFSGDEVPGTGTFIVQKGTNNGTTVGANGSFYLPLANPGNKETLIFAFIGYATKEVTIFKEDYQKEVPVVLMETDLVLGEIAIAYRTISPRRWWWNFRSLFRRSY